MTIPALGRVLALTGLAGLLLGACSSPTSSTAPSPVASATTAVAGPDEGRIICTMPGAAGGGSYYLNVVSETVHDFSACTGGERTTVTLDNLFALPGNVDRRCFLSVEAYHAIVAVYSSSNSQDISAARQRCSGASVNG